MTERHSSRRALVLGSMLALWACGGAGAAETYTEQNFMDAAHDNCSRVEKRNPKSCACEQKLIKDRLSAEDKEMAYYYWTDQAKFVEKFEESAAPTTSGRKVSASASPICRCW